MWALLGPQSLDQAAVLFILAQTLLNSSQSQVPLAYPSSPSIQLAIAWFDFQAVFYCSHLSTLIFVVPACLLSFCGCSVVQSVESHL